MAESMGIILNPGFQAPAQVPGDQPAPSEAHLSAVRQKVADGRSQKRTRLCIKYPVNRENTGKIFNFYPILEISSKLTT